MTVRDAREVSDGADKWAQAISGREKEGGRGGNGCQLARLGRPRKKTGGEERKREGRPAGRRGRKWASRPK